LAEQEGEISADVLRDAVLATAIGVGPVIADWRDKSEKCMLVSRIIESRLATASASDNRVTDVEFRDDLDDYPMADRPFSDMNPIDRASFESLRIAYLEEHSAQKRKGGAEPVNYAADAKYVGTQFGTDVHSAEQGPQHCPEDSNGSWSLLTPLSMVLGLFMGTADPDDEEKTPAKSQAATALGVAVAKTQGHEEDPHGVVGSALDAESMSKKLESGDISLPDAEQYAVELNLKTVQRLEELKVQVHEAYIRCTEVFHSMSQKNVRPRRRFGEEVTNPDPERRSRMKAVIFDVAKSVDATLAEACAVLGEIISLVQGSDSLKVVHFDDAVLGQPPAREVQDMLSAGFATAPTFIQSTLQKVVEGDTDAIAIACDVVTHAHRLPRVIKDHSLRLLHAYLDEVKIKLMAGQEEMNALPPMPLHEKIGEQIFNALMNIIRDGVHEIQRRETKFREYSDYCTWLEVRRAGLDVAELAKDGNILARTWLIENMSSHDLGIRCFCAQKGSELVTFGDDELLRALLKRLTDPEEHPKVVMLIRELLPSSIADMSQDIRPVAKLATETLRDNNATPKMCSLWCEIRDEALELRETRNKPELTRKQKASRREAQRRERSLAVSRRKQSIG